MCPPLWRAVMDHRVVAHYDGDISKANLAPRLRKRILASDKGFIDAA
jgi:alkane 1-monooxygenase